MSGWPDAVRLAVGTLTAWPVAAPSAVDRRAGGRAMVLAPLVGAGLGVLGSGVAWLAGRCGLSTLVAAALTLAVLALATRGLHLDGLADTADGFAASYDRGRALEVMRRGDVGPAGAATLVLVLLVQVGALAQALAQVGAVSVVLAVTASRLALPVACVRGVPAARPDGLGATVSGSVPVAAAAAAVLVVAGIGLAPTWSGHGSGWRGPVAVLCAVLVSGLLVRRAVTRLGGITGDVLGAGVEAALAAALVVLAVS